MLVMILFITAAAATAPPEAEVTVAPARTAESDSLEATLSRVQRLLQRGDVELPQAKSGTGSARPNAAKDVLAVMMESPDPLLRARAVEGWAASGAAASTERLIDALLDPDAAVRAAAARALKSEEGPMLFETLLAWTKAQDSDFMPIAPEILPLFEEQLGLPILTLFEAESGDPYERMACAYILGVLRYAPAVDALTEGLYSADAELVQTCVNALWGFGPSAYPHIWFDLLEHPDDIMVFSGVEALGQIGGDRAFDALSLMAAGRTSQAEQPQLRAMQLIGTWPDGKAVPALIQVMAENPRLGSAINKLLAGKTQRDYGPQANIWADWWYQMTGQVLFPSPDPAQAGNSAPLENFLTPP